jgi:AcrR family transcriptional regulator
MSRAGSHYERRRLETRQRILTAAADLFGEQGVQATKIWEICKVADVSYQSFFNHFQGKEGLVRELVGSGCDFVVATIENAHREGTTTGERIALFFSHILDATKGAGPMHHELLVETFRSSQVDADLEGERRIREAIERVLRSGIDTGEVTREHEVDDLVLLIFGALNTLMLEWASTPDYPIAERSRRLAQLLDHAVAPATKRRAARRRP